MNGEPKDPTIDPETQEMIPPSGYQFDLDRRDFIKLVGAGLLITVAAGQAEGQRSRGGRGGGGGRSQTVAMRLHIGEDGTLTAMTGKVEEGQGGRAEISQAIAEELRVPVERIRLIMADTDLVPDDGLTAGSRTTSGTIPSMRPAYASARQILVGLACAQWQAAPEAVEVSDGVIKEKAAAGRSITYAELAKSAEAVEAFKKNVPADVTVTPVKDWKAMGLSAKRPNSRDIVTGAHQYPSDVIRPGMMYGKALRAPSYGAELKSIDLAPAQAMKDVVVVRDGNFVGCAAPTTHRAIEALQAVAATAQWNENPPQPASNKELSAYLKEKARPARKSDGVEQALAGAAKKMSAAYELAYIQHTPMEPRAAAAEWADGKLTAWVGTDNPFGIRRELMEAFKLPEDKVRVIVPDMGGGFGGKHSDDAAIEAARLAKAAGKPVAVHWTRQDEFTWAYCRPAAFNELRAGLDATGKVIAWDHINYNAGSSGIDTPYIIEQKNCQSLSTSSPLPQGSYRCLGATGNNFAREAFMDELAAEAGADPLAFRLAQVDDRMRAVLEAAAEKFGWEARKAKKEKDVGIGVACGTEKGSVVAACVEVFVDRAAGRIQVRHVCEAFECGPILNPRNLTAQVKGCIIMGLGGALSEEMLFENGRILNASFTQYQVPRFKDVPPIDVILLNKPGETLIGGGETPIIAIAPAISNAVFNATGIRLRAMPMRLPAQA